jgi:hypothetical protein
LPDKIRAKLFLTLPSPSGRAKLNASESSDPARTTNHSAKCYKHQGPIPHYGEITIYTDGACMKNRKKDAQCSSGIWFGKGNPKNSVIRIPSEAQSN